MKTHVTIGKHEIALFGKDSTETTLRNVLFALDGLSFEKKGGLNACECKCHIGQVYVGCSDCQKKHYLGQVSEQKPFSVDNPPKQFETYWYITQYVSEFCVEESTYHEGSAHDVRRLTQNNCYRTEKEAEAALSRVLQSLKS